MSVYEFICRGCRKRFTVEKPISEFNPRAVRCPKCKGKKLDRIWGGVQVHTSKKS